MTETKKKRVRIFTEDQKHKNTERARLWAKNNPEKHAEYQSAWKSENKERIASSNRKWQKENPEKISGHRRNRRAKRLMAEGCHTPEDIDAILFSQRGLCANCQSKLFKSGRQKFHVDHVMPLALGGSNWPENLQCLCPTCNLSKGAKHPDDWAAANGRLL